MITAALSSQLKVLSTQENYNNEIGVPQTLLQLDHSHQAAVIEMGMRGRGQIEYLAKMARPDIGVITNIGPQHIELLGSLENIASAKAELIRALPREGTAVLPADDAMFEYLKNQTDAHVVSFGQSAAAQYRVVKSTFDAHGSSPCQIETRQNGILELRLQLPGIHNAINAAAALAAADVCGIDLNSAIHELQNLQVPGARMQLRHTGKAIVIDDCYNAGPFSMCAALEVLQEFPKAKRRVAVLGSMLELGDWSEREHIAIAEQASGIAQLIIGVGEETKVLLDAAPNAEVHWFENAAQAAEWIPARVQEGDVILVKGSRSIGLEKVVEALHA
jgi:UDP-N-acetylmuramoyl-tripeptide--D-alanyl-D-alanine ligase